MSTATSQYRYYAFISYKSEDARWAVWLQKRLERYSLPVSLQKNSDIPRKLSPVFRDGTDILPKELKQELHEKLIQSRYLIVLCSPRSAQSDWVGDEIEQFCRMGRRDRIVSLIIEGTPYSDDPALECYHPVLKKWFPKGSSAEDDYQLLGADLHAAGTESRRHKRERAFVQIVATLTQLPFDSLWNRRRRQLRLQLGGLLSAAAGIAILFTLTWIAGRPFDMQVILNEKTPHNSSLPFGEGELSLVAGKDTLGIKKVNGPDAVVSFDNIPGKFRGDRVRFIFSSYGYHTCDTLVELGRNHVLDIRRDRTFAIYSGHIYTDDGMTPAGNVSVQIGEKITATDSDGRFCVEFPVPEQSLTKHVIISQEGHLAEEYDLQPQTDHRLILY